MSATEGTTDSGAGRVWDAQAEVDIAVMIRRYLAEHPPPPYARLAGDLDDWATNLQRHGRKRLEACGRRHLRDSSGA